jgi:hypothetical protein
MRYWLTLLAIFAASNAAGAGARKPGKMSSPSARRGPIKVSQRIAKASLSSGEALHAKPKLRPAGEIRLITYQQTWEGRVLTPKGHIIPSAHEAISKILGATGTRPAIPERLVYLLVRASDEFGGHPLRVVSGYRTTSYSPDSRHRQSAAVDFSIIGVRNSALRDYLLTLEQVGVGYYPNSSFVHLDVRTEKTFWIDYAGPGEPPRYTPRKLATSTVAQSAPTEALVDQGTNANTPEAPQPASDQVQESVVSEAIVINDSVQ